MARRGRRRCRGLEEVGEEGAGGRLASGGVSVTSSKVVLAFMGSLAFER
jgi:hypothetical protein